MSAISRAAPAGASECKFPQHDDAGRHGPQQQLLTFLTGAWHPLGLRPKLLCATCTPTGGSCSHHLAVNGPTHRPADVGAEFRCKSACRSQHPEVPHKNRGTHPRKSRSRLPIQPCVTRALDHRTLVLTSHQTHRRIPRARRPQRLHGPPSVNFGYRAPESVRPQDDTGQPH